MKRSPLSRWSGLHRTDLVDGLSCVSTVLDTINLNNTCKLSGVLKDTGHPVLTGSPSRGLASSVRGT